jgi:hypothetical protein
MSQLFYIIVIKSEALYLTIEICGGMNRIICLPFEGRGVS